MPEIDSNKALLILTDWRRAVILFTKENSGLHVFAAQTYFATRRLAGHAIEKGEANKNIYPFAEVKRTMRTINSRFSSARAYREMEKNLLDEGDVSAVFQENDPERATFVMKLQSQVNEVLINCIHFEILKDRNATLIYRSIMEEIHRRQDKHGLRQGPTG